MFSKLSVVVVSVLATLVAAGGSTQCCTSVQNSDSSSVAAVAALVGLDLSGLNIPVGLGCSPITVVGNNCGGTTVTCDAPEKQWGSLIAINCIPITL
ncbi:fungal hydrophobin [Mycena belliarum]|uniref:Hydrophobin n=1 Tax=Mycena belliarum TaxID=1033014 RepID=A0AAD6XKB1_9AGAR|nr:fungal hydrophobin [Mycena belliae]